MSGCLRLPETLEARQTTVFPRCPLTSRRRHALLLSAGALALVLMLRADIPSDWQYPAYPNLHYNTYVAAFNAAPVGSDVEFPINPSNRSFTPHKRSP
ncbi:MAG TPA: hypothetical protein VFU60_19440 [Ktedonobacterales bacterium]|nr:hypothetical protein [Ktedonobacterales bacterium]